jgi:hypothetical protein
VCYIADIALRALRQANPIIASRPVPRWHAAPGFWVVAKALRTLSLVVALAETGCINVAALRAIGHACLPLKGIDHSGHAGAIAARLVLIRRTVIKIVEITMITLGTVGQRNLVVAHGAAMITRGQAHAGVARVSREVAGAGRHTIIPVDLLPGWATGFGGTRWASTGNTATSIDGGRAGTPRIGTGQSGNCHGQKTKHQDQGASVA